MKNLLAGICLLFAASIGFGAVPDYKAFIGTNGITVISNPPTGPIIINGAGVSGSGSISNLSAYAGALTRSSLIVANSTNFQRLLTTYTAASGTNVETSAGSGYIRLTNTGWHLLEFDLVYRQATNQAGWRTNFFGVSTNAGSASTNLTQIVVPSTALATNYLYNQVSGSGLSYLLSNTYVGLAYYSAVSPSTNDLGFEYVSLRATLIPGSTLGSGGGGGAVAFNFNADQFLPSSGFTNIKSGVTLTNAQIFSFTNTGTFRNVGDATITTWATVNGPQTNADNIYVTTGFISLPTGAGAGIFNAGQTRSGSVTTTNTTTLLGNLSGLGTNTFNIMTSTVAQASTVVAGSYTNTSLPTNALMRVGPGGILTTGAVTAPLLLSASGVLSLDTVLSNGLASLIVANDTTTSNGLFSVETTRNAAVSNGVVAYTDLASSNRVRVVGGTGGITVSQAGSGGVQTFTVSDDDAGGGASATFNANQFAPSTGITNIRSGVLATNIQAYGTASNGITVWPDANTNGVNVRTVGGNYVKMSPFGFEGNVGVAVSVSGHDPVASPDWIFNNDGNFIPGLANTSPNIGSAAQPVGKFLGTNLVLSQDAHIARGVLVTTTNLGGSTNVTWVLTNAPRMASYLPAAATSSVFAISFANVPAQGSPGFKAQLVIYNTNTQPVTGLMPSSIDTRGYSPVILSGPSTNLFEVWFNGTNTYMVSYQDLTAVGGTGPYLLQSNTVFASFGELSVRTNLTVKQVISTNSVAYVNQTIAGVGGANTNFTGQATDGVVYIDGGTTNVNFVAIMPGTAGLTYFPTYVISNLTTTSRLLSANDPTTNFWHNLQQYDGVSLTISNKHTGIFSVMINGSNTWYAFKQSTNGF